MNKLSLNRLNHPRCCNLIVIDNFYDNPTEIQNFAFKQKYFKLGKIPGPCTKGFATTTNFHKLHKIISHFGGKISFFDIANVSSN